MSGTTSFFVDCSSFQGLPSWARVAAVCAGGAEKVTEGTGYVNPFWAASKGTLLQVAAHGFVPVAYLFLDAGPSGAAQAEYFAAHAGSLAGFGIAIDLERSAGSPTVAQAQDCAAELRKLYPGHPLGGYAPHWYTGGVSLGFCDWLWASEYVNGSGDPGVLYKSVPAAWWAPYGGKSPLMLQFTPSAVVAGVSGPVDCSAFPGTAAQLAAQVLPATPKAPAPVVPVIAQEVPVADAGAFITLAAGEHVNIPVSAALPSQDFAIVVTGDTGALLTVTAWFTDGSPAQQLTYPLGNGAATRLVFRRAWSGVGSVKLQRADSKTALSATAVVRF